MIFNDHSDLSEKHAFLSPSNSHWLNYTDEHLAKRYETVRKARRGTDLHALAHEAIRLNVSFGSKEKAMGKYVRDALGYKMECEQPLFYSFNCFGTPDTISFRRNKLRIHDLKTGTISATFKQLFVYAALFCLEYGFDPFAIEIELRIYQGEDFRVEIPFAEDILEIMETIVNMDKQIEMMKLADQ